MKDPIPAVIVGTAAWILGFVFLDISWASSLLLLAPLVLVPLAVSLAVEPKRAARLQLPAALLLLGSFAMETGLLAGLMALPWLAFTAITALVGLSRVAKRGLFPVEETCIDAGRIFIVVGGFWTVVSRLGIGLFGFEGIIILLTGIHFHYAGFVLPILVGLAGRVIKSPLVTISAACVMAGVPLVAAGITLDSIAIQLLAACTLAFACVLLVVLQLRLSVMLDGTAGVLFMISSGCLVAGMALAILYSGRWFPSLDIPTMRHTHGTINALGFALPALAAWSISASGKRRA